MEKNKLNASMKQQTQQIGKSFLNSFKGNVNEGTDAENIDLDFNNQKELPNSLNSLPTNPKILKELIENIVQESQLGSRLGASSTNKSIAVKKSLLNSIKIEWPPTKESFGILCKALNLKVNSYQTIDAIVYCRGPKMEQEPQANFNFDKLVSWFIRNQRTLFHENIQLVDKDWLSKNKVVKNALNTGYELNGGNNPAKLGHPTPHQPDPKQFLKMTDDPETKIFGKRFRTNQMNKNNYDEISNEDTTPGRMGRFKLKNLNQQDDFERSPEDENKIFKSTETKFYLKEEKPSSSRKQKKQLKGWEQNISTDQTDKDSNRHETNFSSQKNRQKINLEDQNEDYIMQSLPKIDKYQSLRTSRSLNPDTVAYTTLHRKDKKVALERNSQFQNQMAVTLTKIKELSGVKKGVLEKLLAHHSISQQEKEERANQLALKAEKDYQKKVENQEKEEEEQINKLIMDTAKLSALQAVNLSQLLKKKWSEQKDSYKILTKINNQKDKRRVHSILYDRQLF